MTKDLLTPFCHDRACEYATLIWSKIVLLIKPVTNEFIKIDTRIDLGIVRGHVLQNM